MRCCCGLEYLAAGERHRWYCVVRTLPESASGDDGVFDPYVRVLVGEPGRQVFEAVKVIELGALSGSVLHAQSQDLISNGITEPVCGGKVNHRLSLTGTLARSTTMFDIACLNEQPSNKLRLHTLCHGGRLQRSSRGITHEQSHGYVRVGTMQGGLGIRLRAVVPGLWRVDPHDPLHLSPCIRLHLSGPT